MINFVFGIFGIIGGVLCAIGDILFDLKGKNNVKSGHPKIIDSNWQIMSEWRFKASVLFAALGVPLYLFGFLGMANHLAQSSRTAAITFLAFSVVGACGGLFIHALVCIMPIISKTLTKNGVNSDIIENICIKIYNTVKIPFIAMFLSLVIATSIILIYAIIKSYLDVPFIFVILNPLGLMLIGWLFRLINKDIFCDLPGIIMPSVGIAMIGLMTALTGVTLYSETINESYQRLEAYNVKTFNTEFGTMSYVDEGFGEAIIISHGIFGGYDQGYQNLHSIFGENYRKIAVSRFGYPGSNLPQEPNPSKQARVFLELLNELQIDKVFLIAASAGGAAGIRFALDYPDRLKGLILLSSGVPSVPMTKKELGMSGPPKFILNDRLMLFSIRNVKGVFYSMFGSKNVPDEVFDLMLPVKPRKNGIIYDTEINNIDMAVNFNDYPVENLNIPILVIQAKDDPMVKYEDTEYFLKRVNAELMIFPDGGHLIIGHDITGGVINFVERNSEE